MITPALRPCGDHSLSDQSKRQALDPMTPWGRPHDLLWVAPGVAPECLRPLEGDTLASWVQCLAGPVVVRRGPAPVGHIAIGLRGRHKGERQAATIAKAAVIKGITPDALASAYIWAHYRMDHPVLQRLQTAAPILNEWVAAHKGECLSWGITGSLGYELASGLKQLHQNSDLDLLLRCPQPLARQQAQQLWDQLNGCRNDTRLDIQLETPHGAISLAEWASHSPQVLLKTEQGPQLTDHPWPRPALHLSSRHEGKSLENESLENESLESESIESESLEARDV
ncbi:malonate decarboxylase holo-[acyl-carrier-protein] synthase [Terasakiispira papahanaumokuakeensis]|uniref:Malonate decarboxylase holo-[acyl-carrier-protein] synthase n=1 Tax=Terasakiispira papahanaumokuakeensis TaxID=197479 RepID=A0A1E2V983_9GAMM|nr:malonate decarboxylase holo-[acyl-carrier-protein] synthase [Terasakiispira papahanaumokuakeensis]